MIHRKSPSKPPKSKRKNPKQFLFFSTKIYSRRQRQIIVTHIHLSKLHVFLPLSACFLIVSFSFVQSSVISSSWQCPLSTKRINRQLLDYSPDFSRIFNLSLVSEKKMDPIASVMEKVKGFVKSSQDLVSRHFGFHENPSRQHPVSSTTPFNPVFNLSFCIVVRSLPSVM